MVYLHGGFAFGEADWEDAAPFVDAGYVLLLPMLRGENGNPGVHQSFLGEVDDAIAAGEYVASLRHVDSDRVFLVGHSVGAMLTVLGSMLKSPYSAAAAYDAHLDMRSWAINYSEVMPYDSTNEDEIRVRDPMKFAHSVQCPLRLYCSKEGQAVNAGFARLARKADRPGKLMIMPQDDWSMVAPAVTDSIEWLNTAFLK